MYFCPVRIPGRQKPQRQHEHCHRQPKANPGLYQLVAVVQRTSPQRPILIQSSFKELRKLNVVGTAVIPELSRGDRP